MEHGVSGAGVRAVVCAAVLSILPAPIPAQTVYICEDNGRSFAFSGAGDAPPGCRALADPGRELTPSQDVPDLDAMNRELRDLSDRIGRLETLLLRPAPRVSPLARPAPRQDPFDTRGRTRDLGQDIDRRLDGFGR